MAQKKGEITIKRLLSGWAYDLSGSNSAAVEGLESEISKSSGIMTNRPGFEGHISPGLAFSAITDSSSRITGKPLNAAGDSAGNFYTVLDNARVVEFTEAGTSAHNATAAHGGHSSVTGTFSDIVSTAVQTGTPPSLTTNEYVFYSWDDNTDGDVGRFTKGGAYDDDYLSTLATQSNGTALFKGVPHPLLVARDDVLYAGNGRYLASHDPTSTTVNYQALDLKTGWVITSLGVWQNFIAILAYRKVTSVSSVTKSETRLFLWNGRDPSWNHDYDVKDWYGSALFNDGEELYVFSQGRNNTTKMKRFTGAGLELVKESGQIGSSPAHGGVDVFLNEIVWGSQNGQLLSYGQGLQHISAQSNIGVVKNLTQNTLFIGHQNGSTYTIQTASLSEYATSATLRSILYPIEPKSTITDIQIWFSQFGSGASLTISLFKDYNPTSVGGANDLLNRQLTNANEGTVSYIPLLDLNIDNVNAFYLFLTLDHAAVTNAAAIIRKIKVKYTYDDDNV